MSIPNEPSRDDERLAGSFRLQSGTSGENRGKDPSLHAQAQFQSPPPAGPPPAAPPPAAPPVQRANSAPPPPPNVRREPAAESGTFVENPREKGIDEATIKAINRPVERRKRRLFRKKWRPPTEEGKRRVPAWLVSLVSHLVLLIVLALIPTQQIAGDTLQLLFGEGTPAPTDVFELSAAGIDQQIADLVNDPLDDPAPEQLTSLSEVTLPSLTTMDQQITEVGNEIPAAAISSIPFGITKGLSGRTGALKSALLAKFGGTKETEDAVELGLAWLAKQQRTDGAWSLVGPYSKGGATENRVAATAMAVNAFLGAGYAPEGDHHYATVVSRGLDFLISQQDGDGSFMNKGPAVQSQHVMYSQAIASIAVIEAYGMVGGSKFRDAAIDAVEFAEWAQSDLNGWRYNPRDDADLSVTGWYVMVLETAKMAGLKVDETKLQRVHKFLDTIAHDDGARYSYTELEPPSLTMTAEGLLCRMFLGWPRSHPAVLQGVTEDLLRAVPYEDDPEYSVYFWYYATQVMHHVGGEPWQEWNREMRRVLPMMQVKEGKEIGSWDPSLDLYQSSGGRLYTTCLTIYCLEVYYRHLALYDVE